MPQDSKLPGCYFVTLQERNVMKNNRTEAINE